MIKFGRRLIGRLSREVRSAVAKPLPSAGYQKSADELFGEMSNLLKTDAVGFGCDAHSETVPKHWSSAYGMLCSAGLRRPAFGHGRVVEDCVNWLLENRGCASTQAPLWCLPYPRKIWEDQAPCTPGTAFCIPSCHAIQALLEFSTADNQENETLRARAREAAVEGAQAYASSFFDESEKGFVFWYSALASHSFHVTNATAMMAGQVQRCAFAAPDVHSLAEKADGAVAQLLDWRHDDGGVMAWDYFGAKVPSNRKNRRNDFLHEAFVCHGLLEYKQWGGRHSGEYDYADLLAALLKYEVDGVVFDYPRSEAVASRRRKRARAIGMGHGLYVISELAAKMPGEDARRFANRIVAGIGRDYFVDGELSYSPNDRHVTHYVRTVSHVLLGLAAADCLKAA